MSKIKKSLVTGGAGFLGTRLVEKLYKKGEKVVVFDNLSRGFASARNLQEIKGKCEVVVGDILDFELLSKTISSGFDTIYHLAALPSHRLALEAPRDYVMVDIAGTANVLEAIRLSQSKPLLVFASSNKVYGKQKCPWREDKLPQPEGPYAVAKWTSEEMCRMYYKYFEVPCMIIRFHHVAGPRSNPDLALSIFVEAALKNQSISIHGQFVGKKFASCSADYTHVDDAIRATLLAVKKYKGFEIFNVANKKLIDVKYMAEYVVKRLNSKSKVNLVKMLKHETLKHHSDVSKVEKKLGFIAEIPIEKAIDDYIDWRLKQRKKNLSLIKEFL